ncbi:right-handed parallel beta-helix repeat-containing protein [Paenibacillus psychroresistens]|uniref:Right-handed parallel beta-helix repeat-containing protein n=1 Tax=Paenibacillus psychroresistens TaxID=1778678 RepID=A0A6B8RCH2_9BACL|nr:right-handed parallel beta-helix repeat-containing protein [Paenibacillus psychroresistens]QGQ93900.1 right-handed parallel beta-helix repeat-containing protein [Paenibacillus psychroresistens]
MDYYIAANGSDNQNGSIDAPFQSITKAQQAVREYIKLGMKQDVTVYLRGGLYELESPLRFEEKDSGRDGFQVRYCSFPGEEATLFGGKRITEWVPFDENIWQAKLESGIKFNTLYADDARVKQARLPAVGYFETDEHPVSDVVNSKQLGIHYHAEDFAADCNLAGAQAFVWPGEGEWNWFSELKPIASVDADKCYLQFESPSTWPIGAGSRYYVQGALGLLRAPGQFHLDSSAGVVYYWPANEAANPNEQTIIAPMVQRLLDISGAGPQQLVSSLIFSELTLACTDFFREYRMMDDNVEQDEHREGLVYINHAEDVRIEACKLLNSGSCGVFLDHYSRHIVIDGNDIQHLGYIGISLNGFAPGAGPFVSAAASYTNCHNRITNNRIEHGGELVGHGCGILLYQSGDNEIAHNLIADMPRYGVSMKGLRHKAMPNELYDIPVTWDNHWEFLHSRNNYIAFNDISGVMTDSQDGGLIEAWGVGRGNIIHSNFLHDSGIHFSFGFGIYLDDAADDFTVTNNVITRLYSTGEGKLWMLIFSKGIGNRIKNNLLVSNPQAISAIGSQEMADEENKHIQIDCNIIYNSGYLYYFVNYSDERFTAADRNMYWRDGEPCLVAGCLPLPSSVEDVLERNEYDLAQWRTLSNGKYDGETLLVEPLFVQTEAANYRLLPHSPAYGLGWTDIEFAKIGPK